MARPVVHLQMTGIWTTRSGPGVCGMFTLRWWLVVHCVTRFGQHTFPGRGSSGGDACAQFPCQPSPELRQWLRQLKG